MVRYGDSSFNDIYVGGEAGPEFRVSGGRLRVAATGLQRWYGGKPLVASLGGRLHFDKVIGGKMGPRSLACGRHNAYSRPRDVDGWDIEASLSANRRAGAIDPRFRLCHPCSARSQAIPATPTGRAGSGSACSRKLPWGLRPQLSLEAGRQVNDAPLGLFGKARRDWRVQTSASIYKRDWNLLGFAPSVRLTWTRTFSTIALYDQKRLRAEVGVTRAF